MPGLFGINIVATVLVIGGILLVITGLRLLDTCVGLFVERREKIYLFIMSGAVKE